MTSQTSEVPTSPADGAPAPVIVAEHDTTSILTGDDEFLIHVLVGGVRVITRTYTNDPYAAGRTHHVDDVEEAKAKALEAFGVKLATLLGESGW